MLYSLLTVVLISAVEFAGLPADLALIFGVDRILDMLRTATNVTGDATVASIVAASEGQLRAPDLDESKDQIRLKGVG